MASSYKDLIAWRKSIDLVIEIYRITSTYPKNEVYGLTSQLRRASVSVPSNIAEGQAHFSKPEFKHFLRHAKGSLAEMETQVIISEKLSYIDKSTREAILPRIDEIGRMLSGLIAALEK